MRTIISEIFTHSTARIGAKNCIGAGSDAEATTTIENFIAPALSKAFTNLATEDFCPIATYIQ